MGSSAGHSPESSNRRQKSVWQKLVLLMWKNLLLRRRHWLLTAFEILLPTLLFTLIVTIRVLPDSTFIPHFVSENSTFPTATETELRIRMCERHGFFCLKPDLPQQWKIFYGPDSTFTRSVASYLAHNINLNDNNLQAVSSIEDMDMAVDKAYFQANQSIPTFFVGLFFHDHDKNGNDFSDTNVPERLIYDLRLPKIWLTQLVYPYFQIPGPRNYSGFFEDAQGSYNLDGFTVLQTIVDRYYIYRLTKNETYIHDYKLETQMYPYPPYIQDSGMSQVYGSMLPTFVVLSLVLLSPSLIKSVVHEKDTGVRELIRLMGLDGWLVWLGWFLHSFGIIIVVSSIMTFLMKLQLMPTKDGTTLLPPILANSDGFFVWVLLLLYGVSSITFCFAISTFFSKPTLATTVGILLWLCSYFIPSTIMYDRTKYGLGAKLASCLLPNMAITWAFDVMGTFEGRSIGVQWNNLWETGNPRGELTMGMILLMLVLDTLLFLLVVWYVDQVSPGKYGVPRPFYFPFQRSYWGCARPSDSVADNPTCSSEEHQYFEEEPEGLKPGIVIRNLRKEFRTLGGKVKVAVENVSMTCYEGQCTVLLGHNGAGKTTTMSVLTGVYAPSGGQAEVCGWNIATHLREARMELGLCPQHNMLFVHLTVLQHLLFFGRLKGLTTKAARKEAEVLMGRLDLLQKKHLFGKQLSGGMKRKLSLAISLIGGSKVVILDEPSSGLDPESRRWVWDVVQGERGRRTILVTTHHMEEADVLGDRVAIMANGRVICAGSTLFLKHKFGDGYTLEMIVREECNLQVLTKEVTRHVPEAVLHKSGGGEVTFRLPPDTAQYGPLVESLACHKDGLGLTHFGLSLTTMERVFLRVSEAMNEEDERLAASDPSPEDGVEGAHHFIDEAKIENGISANSQQFLYNSQTSDQITLTGWPLFLNRIKAIFIKRAIYLLRKWPLFITQGLVPVVVTIVCLLVDSNMSIFSDQERPLPLTLSAFPETFSYVKDGQDLTNLTSKYKSLFYDSHTVEEAQNITSSLLQVADKNIQNFREKHISSASFVNRKDHIALKAWAQTIPHHAVGIGTSLVTSALLRSATNSNVHTITTINHPLPPDNTWKFSIDFSTSSIIYPALMSLALSFLSASFLVFPHQERVSNSKQVQVMTGTPVWMLWAINFIWDQAVFCVTLLLIFIFFMSLDFNEHFTIGAAPGALVLLLLLFGWGSIPMAYVFSFPFHTAAAGFAALAFISIITGQLVTAVVMALKFANNNSLDIAADVIHWIASIIPVYSVANGFSSLVKTSVHNAKCDVFDETTTKLLCFYLAENAPGVEFLECCLNPPLCETSEKGICFEKWSYFAFNDEGLGQILLVLFVNGLIFLLLIVMIEIGIPGAIRQLWQKLTCKKDSPVQSWIQLPTDEDVIAETNLVSNLITGNDIPWNEIKLTERSSGNMMLVHHLAKQYSTCAVRSVDDISFRVGKGECLGLLGVNGAGKTTTFKMLTGEEVPTAGDAKIGNLSLSHQKRNFLQHIGYCPQFDAFIEELTGIEMLHLMGRLRGLSTDHLKETVASMIRQVGLTECARRPSSTYSGGNRRKLSTAMALIGDPPLVFLDEPTSGVDPASRRRVWAAISQAVSSGQSVVLTSHSMEECEALCSRIIIMSCGILRCVGTSGHLKAKFGQGYSLQVKLKTHGFDKNDRESDEYIYNVKIEDLKHVIRSHLPGITLTDQHKGMLSYWVPTSVTWAQLFSVMESLKAGRNPDTNATDTTHTMSTPSIVEAYAASDTSLEQVFLAFAREASRMEDKVMEISQADHTLHTTRGPDTQQPTDITTAL